jgi:hypothetical protein
MRIESTVRLMAALTLAFVVGCGGGAPDKPKKTSSTDKSGTPTKSTGSSDGSAAAAPAEGGWGNLTGRFVYKGDPPTPEKLSITKDVEVCSKHAPIDERLLVSADGGIANVAIYVRDNDVKVHPDYEATASDNVELDNLHCRFSPHVAMLRTGQTLVLKNSDSVGHNTKGDCFVNAAFNILIPSGGTAEPSLGEPERLPVKVGCNIHPWMQGWVLIQKHPYMAVTAEDGSFTIENLPTGIHEVQLWQEAAGYLRGVQTKLGVSNEKNGRLEVAIHPGDNDLGDIEVDPSMFKDE